MRPNMLVQAMRHGVMNGGKRLRPFLVVETAALFDGAPQNAMACACALECLHCYSLVHDDLPAMDDDDMRRGQPTVHKAFDEATAILAGDALLTLAFDILTREDAHPDPAIRCELVSLLARASGQGGMIGGQILDIAAETRTPSPDEITTLQAMKTGALITYACEAGAVLGGASAHHRQTLAEFGKQIGLAFQLADDLLDVTSTQADMGKAVGKDAQKGKGTLVGIHGVETAKTMLEEIIKNACELLTPFGASAELLKDTARFIAKRKN